MKNSFNTKTEITCSNNKYTIFDISKINGVRELPYSIKILLENLLRNEDGQTVTKKDIESIIEWRKHAAKKEIAYRPARVLMQDFTGVPAVVDLAAMRDAIKKLGKSPKYGRIPTRVLTQAPSLWRVSRHRVFMFFICLTLSYVPR